MEPHCLLTSVTRISDLGERPFEVRPLPREEWATGDYVVGEVETTWSGRQVELSNGRVIEVAEGDLLLGAFGRRHATLEATGDWREIGEDGRMEALTAGGLLGRCTSRSAVLAPLSRLSYRGHVVAEGRKCRMADHVEPVEPADFGVPTLLLVGTSMSAGKTTAARTAIRLLKREGVRVVGAKLAGAGRYRDILSMGDAGADEIFDFVDAGLPSTVVPEEEYLPAVRNLLSRMAAVRADVAVVEVGASPLEPYNGEVAIRELGDAVRCSILCASDPYAVLGVMRAYGAEPDLVTGPATNTLAGVELAERLTGLRALDIRRREALPELADLLREKLLGLPV